MRHHKMGMSKWSPWAVCPCYDSVSHSAAAVLGSKKHEQLHSLLTGGGVELDALDAHDRAVRWAADEIFKDAPLPISEETVEIKGVDHMLDGIYGTCDAYYIQHLVVDALPEVVKVLHVYDFKALSNAPGSGKDHWPQLMGYAIAIASGMEGGADMGMKCVLHLLHGGTFYHETKEATIKECVEICSDIVMRRKYASDDYATASPWCRTCGHAGECNAVRGTMAMTQTANGIDSMPLAKRLAFLSLVEGLVKEAKERAKGELALAAGQTVDDGETCWAITRKGGRSALRKGAIMQLFYACQEHGITSDEFLNICSCSSKDVERLLHDKGGLRFTAKDGGLTTRDIVKPYYEKGTVECLTRLK